MMRCGCGGCDGVAEAEQAAEIPHTPPTIHAPAPLQHTRQYPRMHLTPSYLSVRPGRCLRRLAWASWLAELQAVEDLGRRTQQRAR